MIGIGVTCDISRDIVSIGFDHLLLIRWPILIGGSRKFIPPGIIAVLDIVQLLTRVLILDVAGVCARFE
ncbi:hypothetical protein D3C76_988500 [compost metagenome]